MSALVATSPLIQALRGKRPQRTPIWIMRQAGRYLPEYRALRAKHTLLDLMRTPALAAEITLQPLRRFPLDGAIIFADILTPLIGMGVDLKFVEGEGPKLGKQISTLSDVQALSVPAPEENVGYTLEAIRSVSQTLAAEGIPLLGFSGAPFTLAAYLIEGRGSPELYRLKRFIREDSKAWTLLSEKLTLLISDYLIAQAEAGAAAVQLFDSWVGVLSPYEFTTKVLPSLQAIVARVKGAIDVPVIYFSTGSSGLLPQLRSLPVDAFGIDWRIGLREAAHLLGGAVPLQGNLDPTLLLSSWEGVRDAAIEVLTAGKDLPSHVFNLGHGILPETALENVERLVTLVHEFKG